MSCPRCGRSNRAGARFCDGCGAGLAAPSAEKVARKVVTIVFADLIGSTALHEKLDPESVSRVMEAYHAAVRAPIEAHGGTVVQLLGDGVMCAFGVPQVAEDDALRAVRAAVGVQRSFREFLRAHEELAGRVGLRVAVNTGEVVVSDDYAAGIGDPLNVAARLQQEAKDGDVLVGGATQRFVADQVTLAPVGSFALRGRAEPVAAWRVVSLERPSRAAAVDFVGRADELRRLGAVYEAAASGAHAKLALVLGSPGLGKSRLLVELARALAGRATVLIAQCSASGGASFAPLAEPLRAALDAAARADDPERARIEAGIGAILAGTPAPPEESFFVVRRLLAALAAERPVVLVIDDLQWAEPLLLDLVEHLVQWGAGVRLFVLAAARPELRELRSSLAAAGGLVSDLLHLSGLDASASTRLAASVIGADALPAAVAGRVLAASEGNPLFLGELVRMLANDGVLRREGERWVTAVELSDLDMPPNIQALLAARIERLRPEERLVLERAAVVGRQFSRAALAHLLPREAQGDLDARLESLRRSELIELDGGDWFLGEPALRFHHVLIRDAAYRRPLRHTRAELHARFADWLAERAGGDAALHDETIGWHLEQAFLHRRELGALDAPARALGARAARHLADAGRRALARDDLPRAASGLGRALECLDAEDLARAELALDWCEALLAAGDVAPAARALAELGRFAEGSERLRAWHTSFAGQLAVLSDPQALRACEAAVAGAADALAAAGDAAGEAKAHSVHALVLAQLGRIGASEAALDRALAAARRARDRRRANAVLAGAPVAALWGPSPVTRASGRCLDVVRVLRITQGAPAVEAVALRCQAVLETLRGRSEAARRMIASSRRMVEELGIGQRVLEADVFAGLIELLEGDGAAAERWLRPAYAGLRTQGLGIDAAQAAALLGRALLVQGRAEEAEALSRESEALAGDSFKAAIAWRCVRAEALAARGEPEAAVEAARAAVEIAAATDDLLDHADARHALAVALRAAGRWAEADAEEARAIELWQEKGATLLVERAQSAGARAEPSPAREARPALLLASRRVRENAAAASLARFDALGAEPAPPRFENAAVRAGERFIRAWRARDWDAMIAHFAPGFEVDDRRALVGVPMSGPEFFANQRLLFAMKSTRWEGEVLATRGERYALRRARFSGEDDAGGAGEVVLLTLTEVDDTERYVRQVLFDPDAVEAAYQALDARYVTGEGAAYTALLANLLAFRRALADADREALARILPDDFTVTSHRRFANVGATLSRDEYVANLGFYDELGVRTGFRVQHLRVSGTSLILDTTLHGTRAGSDFEQLFLLVAAHDGNRIHGWELFDRDETDAAFARYRALSAAPAVLRIENAATRVSDRVHAAWRARDWAAFSACYAPGYRIVDRQRGVQLESTRAAWLDSYRPIFEMASSQLLQQVLATRGDRLGLFRVSWRGADGAVGASEMDALLVAEADEQGGLATQVVFDPDGFDAAYAELDARYEAGEAAGDAAWREMRSWAVSFERRDLAALAAQAGPGFELRDHRALGWGTVDAERFVELLRSLVELAPDARLRIEHFESRARGSLTVAAMHGTREGGAFEVPRVGVREIDAAGRLRRLDHYDLAQLDAARARFAELREPAPAWRLENAAARAQADFERAWRERRLADVLSSFAQTVELDDRRALVGLRVRGEEFLTNLRLLFETPSSEWRSEPLATRGQRLALLRSHFSAEAGAGAPIAVEHLSLVERGDDRRAVSVVVFDAEQEEAARAELDARFFAGEAAAHCHVAATMRAFLTAFARRDWDAVGALFAEDVAVHDQRRLGWEPLSGRAAYVASLRSLVELSPDVRLRLDHARLSARGVLWVASWVGTREGGPFETPWIIVSEHDAAGIVRRFDQLDVDRLDAALERFAELGPDPLAIPPNAAVWAADRIRQCMRAGDWDGLRALAARGFTFDDRRRRALVSGDIELYARNLEVVQSYPELRPSRELLATLGERIALSRLSYVGGGEADAFEGEFLVLNEVDEETRLHAVIHFDRDDRAAAFAEAHARFVAGEALGHPGQAAISALAHALATHDWEALRACFSADGSVHDRRTLGLGPQGPEPWIASLRALAELAPDVTVEPIRILAWRKGGRMSALRVHGSREGGPFENVFLGVAFARDDRVERYEFFDVADEARALARFEELCAGAR